MGNSLPQVFKKLPAPMTIVANTRPPRAMSQPSSAMLRGLAPAGAIIRDVHRKWSSSLQHRAGGTVWVCQAQCAARDAVLIVAHEDFHGGPQICQRLNEYRCRRESPFHQQSVATS